MSVFLGTLLLMCTPCRHGGGGILIRILFSFLFYFFLNFILFYLLTLQYCIGFAIYQNESATGIHVLPILSPPPSPRILLVIEERDISSLIW